MHQFDDAETIALEVIDATLAGEAVEPEYAELAELTLILAGQRPEPSAEFATALDDRVARRFTKPASEPARRARRRWLYAPGVALAAAAATAVVIVMSSGGGLNGASSTNSGSAGSSGIALDRGAPARTGSANASRSGAAASKAPGTPTFGGSSAAATSSAADQALSVPAAQAAPVPPASGRQVVQSAQLSLSTNADNVDAVAQQVFNVVAAQHGFVKSSQVTAAHKASGYAQFELSVPSSNLGQTMAALSQLHGAHVVSRTDSTQDITQQVGGAGMRLADARALHAALLRKLAAATTTGEIDSLKAQIAAVEARIARDQATLRALHREVNFSNIAVTINAAMVPVHKGSSGGSFTIGKALHDAGRVLVVAAGVGLITLAVLVPVGLVIAVILWVAYTIRRRRRDQALDLV